MLYPPEFEAHAVEVARRCTDDIADCDSAEVSVQWHGQAPIVRFLFGNPVLFGRPGLGVAMVAESRKNPLAPGRLLEGDELKRHIRESVELYLKANGIEISRKVTVENALV